MAFTDIETVRAHAGSPDPERVPDSLLDHAISEAHTVLLRDLLSQYLDSEDETLKLGETELATAYLFRSLARNRAATGREVATLHLRLNETKGVPGILRQAAEEERRAFGRLAPFLRKRATPFGFRLAGPKRARDRD